MSKRNRNGDKINNLSNDFFKLSFTNHHNNILQFVESYVRNYLFNHTHFMDFLNIASDRNFIVVDSLNMSMWTDHYQVVISFIDKYNQKFPTDVQKYADHCLFLKSMTSEQKTKYLFGLSIDNKLDITIGLCKMIHFMTDQNNLPTFIIIHRTTKQNDLILNDKYIIIKISYNSIRSLSEVDDVLCVYMMCLLLCIIDKKQYVTSMLTADNYNWLTSLVQDQYHKSVMAQTKSSYGTIYELIENHKCCVIRENSTGIHVLDYKSKTGFMRTIMRGTM